MAARHRSRERALQMIFQWEASGEAPSLVIDRYWGSLSDSLGSKDAGEDEFANSLLYGVARRKPALDELIQRHAANWRLERMSPVDRNVLRLAAYELEQGSPAPVVINEAIELGRRFSGPDSVKFLNGVLDAVRKALQPESEPVVVTAAPDGDSEPDEPTESRPSAAAPRSDQS